MSDTATTIARVLLEAQAVALRPADPFRFASGILSPVYCDNRLLIGQVEPRRAVVRALAEEIGALGGVEVVAGTATAAIPWAAWVAEALGLPMIYVRSSAKGHGKGNMVEGGAPAGARTVLVEDTVSTGGSSLTAIAAMREQGLVVEHCWSIYSHQMRQAVEGFAAAGVAFHPLSTLSTLVEVAATSGRIRAEDRALIEDWASDPAGWEARRNG